jgi:predicted metal-dependent peptidase
LENGHEPQTTFDEHYECENPELMDTIVAKAHERAAQLAGGVPGHIKTIMELNAKRGGNNLKQVSRALAFLRGTSKTPSYRYENRKAPCIKGNKRIGHNITVIWDWSGSMYGRHEKVVSELYRDGYSLDVIGADTEVKNIFKVTRKEQLKKIPFHGGGGTLLQPAINYVRQNLPQKPLVILTDGELSETLDFSGFKQKVLVITCNLLVNATGGKVSQIKINGGN